MFSLSKNDRLSPRTGGEAGNAFTTKRQMRWTVKADEATHGGLVEKHLLM